MLTAKELINTAINATGDSFSDVSAGGAFQATILGTGAVACTVAIQCSLDATNWITLGSIPLSGTTTATDGFSAVGQWIYYRAVVSGVTGTITSIRVNMSEET